MLLLLASGTLVASQAMKSSFADVLATDTGVRLTDVHAQSMSHGDSDSLIV